MRILNLKHLVLPGAFFLLAQFSVAQSGTDAPWQVFTGTTGLSNTFTIGFGLDVDSQYVYTGFNENEAPFRSFLFRTNRRTGKRDSLLLTRSDSAAFLPFHILVEDSLITCIGVSRDMRRPFTGRSQRSALLRVTKDWHFKDSLIFGELRFKNSANPRTPFFSPWQFLSLGNKYYITETTVSVSGTQLTRLSKSPLQKDTAFILPFGNFGSNKVSITFMKSIQKLFLTSSFYRGLLIDTAGLKVDSNFIAWDTSLPPFNPLIVDLFRWGNDVYGIGNPSDWYLLKYTTQPFGASASKFFESDTINGGELTFRRSYGTTDSLLTFSTSGPFLDRPPIDKTPKYIRIYALNKQGKTVWQSKIENGDINVVHGHAMDDKGTFVYVQNFSSGDPFAVPQKMLIYKLDNNGNVLQIADNKIIKVGLHLYPNPSSGLVHYDASGYRGNWREVSFTVYDTQGREQFSSLLKNEKGTFELFHLPPGSYTYQFENGQEQLRSGILLLQP